ncbi:MAG: carboxypeptidase-like regulatory domain-containing protein, partial [Thermomicrobiales bacterium]
MHMPLRQPSSLRPQPALPWITWKYSLIFAVAIIALIATVIVKAVVGSPSPEIAFRVIDSTGAPVANASITLGDLQRTTDSKGELSIPATNGRQALSITSDGYAAVAGTVDRNDGSKREITLQREVPAVAVAPETPPAPDSAVIAAIVNQQTTAAGSATAVATPGSSGKVSLDANLISGKILDAADAPIQGARVVSGGKWSFTGKDGIFQLNRADVD